VIVEASAGWGARVEDDVEGLLGRLTATARRMRSGSDPEAIHDLRVAARRLASALDVWRALLKRGARRRARRALRRLRRALGPVREAEVEAATLRERLENLPPAARDAATRLLASLERRIARGRPRAAERCAEDRIARIRRRIARAFARARTTEGGALLPSVAARLHARARGARDAVRAAAADPRDETLHQARLAAKRCRYALERLAAAGPPFDALTARARIEPLVAVQEALGRARDLAMLRDRAQRYARKLGIAGHGAAASPLEPLLERLESERREALVLFMRSVAALHAVGTEPASLGLAGGAPRRGADRR